MTAHCRQVDIATAPLRDCISYYNGEGGAEPGSLAYYGGVGMEPPLPGSARHARALRLRARGSARRRSSLRDGVLRPTSHCEIDRGSGLMVETVPVTSASLGHVLLIITLRLRGSTRMLAWLRSAHLGRPFAAASGRRTVTIGE